MNAVPRVLAEASSESMVFVTPLTSGFNDLLDSSEDTTGEEVSKDANKSICVAWEGSQEEKKVWLRGQCDAIFACMNRGESHSGAREEVNAHMQELLKRAAEEGAGGMSSAGWRSGTPVSC